MGSGGFPIDLVLFGMIAAFLVLRLRSILGRRTGFERPPQTYQPPAAGPTPPGPVIDGRAEPVTPASHRAVPEPVSALGQTLTRMQEVDRGFDPAGFLDGAEKAFRMIVAAFANGDRTTLRNLLADDVRLIQSTYPPRAGAADVGMFFGVYSRSAPVRLAAAWLNGREVIAVWEDSQAVKPSYLMWLEWADGRISFIRDYKYVRYVIDDAELVLAPGAALPGKATAAG